MSIRLLMMVTSIAFMLSGCGAGELERTNAYGESAFKVKCKNTPESCLEEAYKACNGGVYTTIYSDSHAGGYLLDIIPAQTTWYQLTFRCGGVGTMPEFPWQGVSTQEASQAIQNLGNSFKSNTTRTRCTTWGNTINCTTR